MDYGQLNIASAQTATQLVTQDSSVPATATLDGMQQNGGDFAGLLSGIQSLAIEKISPDSGQAEQLSIKISKQQLLLEADAGGPDVDLLAQLNVSLRIPTASEPAAPKTEESKKDDISKDVSKDAAPSQSGPSDVTSQIALAAYLQTGRMPEVNIPMPLPVDRLQNVASVTEQPAVVTAPAVETHPEQASVAPRQATPQQPTLVMAEQPVVEPVGQNQQHQAGTVPTTTVDEQPAATIAAAPVLQATPTAAPAQAVAPTVAASSTTPASAVPTAVPSEAPLRTAEGDIPTPLTVDRLQNVATATAQPAVISAPADKSQAEQTTAEPVQTIATEKSVAGSITSKTELPAVNMTAPAPALSLESEVEIQLSQPPPITVQVTVPAVALNHPAAMAQGLPVAMQRVNSEQQIEKVRTGNEQGVVKEMATSPQAGELMLGSDTSSGGDSNKGQSDSASDNQMLTQQMRGQLSTEHQNVAALSTKATPAEPVRQDIPEQVMQQVKERLVQHDVKPGNQQITLTLSPDSLGELKVNLNLQGQKLSVEIVTENRSVRDAIIQHTGALKESLARQNITMESFDVTTGGNGSGNQGQNQSAWRELAKQQQQSWTSPRGYHTAQADVPSGQATYQRQQGQSMLDIHY